MEIEITKLGLPKKASRKEVEDLAEQVVKAILEEFGDEGDYDEEDEETDYDICKECDHREECSEEKKHEHREMFRKFNEFHAAFNEVHKAMLGKTSPYKIVGLLDALSDTSRELSEAIKAKKSKEQES